MRRLFLSTIAFIFVLSCFSSEPKDGKTSYYRHEVNVGIGMMFLSCKQWDYYEDNIFASFHVGREHYMWDTHPTSGLHLGYYYHFNPRIAAGVLTAFTSTSVELENEIDRIKNKSAFLVPTFKWSFLNSRWCSLYMKASAGVHYQKLSFESGTIPKEKTSKFDENKWRLAYIVTPFGWEVGRQKVRWFIEFGLGSNTNLQTGLTYRFGRY